MNPMYEKTTILIMMRKLLTVILMVIDVIFTVLNAKWLESWLKKKKDCSEHDARIERILAENRALENKAQELVSNYGY